MRFRLFLLITLGWLALAEAPTSFAAELVGSLAAAIGEFEAASPTSAAGFERIALDRLARASQAVESAAAAGAAYDSGRPDMALGAVEQFLAAKRRVDQRLDQTLGLAAAVAEAALALPDEARQRETLRNYQRVAGQTIDLAGRLRYLSFDVLRNAGAALAPAPGYRRQFVDLLAQHKSGVGAMLLTNMLLDPANSSAYANAMSATELAQLRHRTLELIALAREPEPLAKLAAFAQQPRREAWLTVQAVDTIRRVGLPQDTRPGQDPTLPPPEVTARQLRSVLAAIPSGSLDPAWEARRGELLTWLEARAAHGVAEDEAFNAGPCTVRPGDWLLMRNPSPYNLFTDLSPGLFTHVGVVAWEKGADGRGRMVLVDLPERGASIPATNVELFLKRTRHYVFLRHKDPEVAKQMGAAAAAVIGNPSEFDLNFRTDRVLELAGQPLAGQKIHTYCAGLLLLCALQTGHPRAEFFPISESCAGGKTAENLKTLGMSFGKDFVSPTGALYSSSLQIVGRREPNYDGQREVEEAIYDHFAARLATTRLTVSPDLYQSLRLKVAAAAKQSKILTDALAQAAGVSKEIDLVSAARAAAVVETLDEIAYGASGQYNDALAALKAGDPSSAQEAQKFQRYRQLHSGLYSLWRDGKLSPRALRIELVKYYTQQGKYQLDRRFFVSVPRSGA